MKKIIISCLIVCLFAVLAQTGLGGVQPDEKAAVILEGFDDLLQEDLGSADGAVSGFDTHYDLGYGDGSMQLVQTNVSRQGLALIPDYVSGYNEGILRATFNRLGSKTASQERAEALKEAWGNADGFRFYLKNNTDDNIALSIPLFFINPEAPSEENMTCFSLYTGTRLYDMNGQLVETEFVSEGWNNHQIIIPWDFEGWVDIPMTLGGVGGNDREGRYGWDLIQWEDAGKLANTYINFENVYMMQLDFRLSTPQYVSELENFESYNIIIDSIQLYREQEGKITYLPDDGTPDLPSDGHEPTAEATPEATISSMASAVSGWTQTASPVGDVQNVNTKLPWIIAGAIVLLAAVAVATILGMRARKRRLDNK